MPTVFITGASSGIGAATADLFKSKGWNVFATGHAECDVTNNKSIVAAVARCIEQHGCIDVLVNNAGVYSTYPLEYTAGETISNILETNIHGTINMIKAVLPHMRQNKSASLQNKISVSPQNKITGIIINVSSIAGMATFPYQCVYHASKWAIEGFSEGLQYELTELGIRVKSVEPGVVKTPLYRNLKKPDRLEGYAKFNAFFDFMKNTIDKGYGPEIPAATIYRAATDGKSKLRYRSGYDTKAILLLRSLLPVSLFGMIVRKVMRA